MRVIERVLDWASGGAISGAREAALEARETAGNEARRSTLLKERLLDVESRIGEDGWQLIASLVGPFVITDRALRVARWTALAMYLRNPFIRAGVQRYCDFVIGEGVSVSSENPDVNQVLQQFWDDYTNQEELTTPHALADKETEQRLFGETFFVLFTNSLTGQVKVSTIEPDEIQGSPVYNPENRRETWYYKRVRLKPVLDMGTGIETASQETIWHPDWRYQPTVRPTSIGGFEVAWDAPVYHVKSGAINRLDRGLSELLPAQDSARAYTEFLEDRMTVARALSRIVAKATATTKAGVSAVKGKLAGMVSNRRSVEGVDGYTRDGGAIGDVAAMGPGKTYEAVSVKGATINPDEGRRMFLAVCAAFGLPETWFGDASVGSLATSKSLDLPTMKAMVRRRAFWRTVLRNILDYVVVQAATKPVGALRGKVKVQQPAAAGLRVQVLARPVKSADLPQPKRGSLEPVPIAVDFPNLIETETGGEIEALATAQTLLGGEGGRRYIAKRVLQVLGEDDVDELLDTMDFSAPDIADPAAEVPPANPEKGPAGDDQKANEA